MTQPNDTARDGSAPAGENEAAIMSDWTEVVALIGTHPSLIRNDLHDRGREYSIWTVRGPGGKVVEATPATVDDLMLAHCQRWLDERGTFIRPRDGAFTVEQCGEFRALATLHPTRIAATIAAVKAAGGAEG